MIGFRTRKLQDMTFISYQITHKSQTFSDFSEFELLDYTENLTFGQHYLFCLTYLLTWCVQVLRSPKEAFAAAMQSWRERCEKCVCLQGEYVEK